VEVGQRGREGGRGKRRRGGGGRLWFRWGRGMGEGCAYCTGEQTLALITYKYIMLLLPLHGQTAGTCMDLHMACGRERTAAALPSGNAAHGRSRHRWYM
jgi:hypothetical protein